ncbi:hypothetical protein [Actinomadura montaniterrae]|uniref:DUF695 domain-containing protein n=1 Tax=Actinomadura montaniterrae TaxID=1803903 RepID=A0A6L3VZ59_9ACTN|nr:hypothetical protein [Actinomadura montaniterrae]KAB2387859.1 hypothetical protein F9B16_06660 [Actinomadura montaniterrae]
MFLKFAFTGDGFGTEPERGAIYALAHQLEEVLEAAGDGEVAGHEFGQGAAEIYLYGPDAGALLQAIRPALRTATPRPTEAVLRYGDLDDDGCRVEVIPL